MIINMAENILPAPSFETKQTPVAKDSVATSTSGAKYYTGSNFLIECPGTPYAIVGYYMTGGSYGVMRMFAQDRLHPPFEQTGRKVVVSNNPCTFESNGIRVYPPIYPGYCHYVILYVTN